MNYASAQTSIVMKGDWITQCNGAQVSNHNRYDKALESAINQKTDCDIIPPLRIEVRTDRETKGILLTWDLPELRTDGSKIEQIDRFNIYVYFDGIFQNIIEVSGASTSFQLFEVKTGNYSFQISTVELGQEGQLSSKIFQEIN